jgi:hypothetical protein
MKLDLNEHAPSPFQQISWLPWFLVVLLSFFIWRLYQLQVVSFERIDETHEAVEKLEQRLSKLERKRITPLSSKRDLPSLETPSLGSDYRRMQNGLYTVDVNLTSPLPFGSPNNTKTYTVYHMKTEIDAGGYQHPIQVGIGIAGYLTAPLVYVDYDADGFVDQQMMHEMLTWLPFQKLFTTSIDPVKSQAIYSHFLKNQGSAKFTDTASISRHGNKLVYGLWKMIEEHSSDIRKLLEKNNVLTKLPNVDLKKQKLVGGERF